MTSAAAPADAEPTDLRAEMRIFAAATLLLPADSPAAEGAKVLR